MSGFMFLLTEVHLFQYHLLKRLSLFCCVAFAPLAEVHSLYFSRSASGFSILFLFVSSFAKILS